MPRRAQCDQAQQPVKYGKGEKRKKVSYGGYNKAIDEGATTERSRIARNAMRPSSTAYGKPRRVQCNATKLNSL
jgi:hypothetical protein